jgi:hypothetical protein
MNRSRRNVLFITVDRRLTHMRITPEAGLHVASA